ncbi:capsular polysaccharide biosynthesis protein [Tateyamaria sp. ANG-S1]|uniref:capsular polysaccharide biosynthesis protein n=1 Tax=Tateyamaria sp. ANG-S1 TaxID=1577905 RepID=UPI00057F9470|nr:capsular polysaccharide biosynthesis protein [Tateyamaria sp. ANG-S1]KIC47963.1 capsular biosynthesis protein [Tateyamaria sp. ANG-S1]
MAAGPDGARRLYVYNGGFLARGRVRRIVELAGYDIAVGLPGPDGLVGVWGNSPTAYRGEAVAERRDASVVRVEDAFLRSVLPGRAGSQPIGLLIDHAGVHFDPSVPSDLERILAEEPLDDTAVLNTARGAMARMQEAHLSKYTGFDPDTAVPEPGYVLVIDQTRGDASVTACGADRNRFLEMLFVAQDEHPGARILIKTHPETMQGFREGYFTEDDCNDRVSLFADAVSPWTLMEGAIAVYTVSSGLGFEAIMAGHKPRVFGQPFYAGWGLTADEFPVQRRQRTLTRAQLFAGAMILYPTWYDPHRDCLCDLPTAMEALAAETRAWRADHRGWVASGMRLWKRRPLQKVFGRYVPMRFEEDPGRARAMDRPWMVWAGKADVGHEDAVRVEDGFLRSRGLGAELIPPLSLVTDDLGIYYDPSRPSRLEHLIRARRVLRPDQVARADALVRSLTAAGLSKYNLSGGVPDLPKGQRVLVVGQVEDDASIRLGAGEIRTNRALLEAARTARPDAVLIYKPHPDVEAGLREGAFDAAGIADVVADRADIAALLDQVEELWTMTSLTGFEALLRRVRVVTTGAPFYAGWGLTEDRGAVPPRRREDVSLAGLVHATLIDYPRYFDPVTGTACPVEIVVERLRNGPLPRPGLANRLLSKLQGLLASQAHLWR